MGVEDKQKLGDALTWIMRGLTALGGFFLVHASNIVDDTNTMLQEHLRQYASDRIEVQIRLGIAEKELERYRNEREQRQQQYQNNRDEHL